MKTEKSTTRKVVEIAGWVSLSLGILWREASLAAAGVVGVLLPGIISRLSARKSATAA